MKMPGTDIFEGPVTQAPRLEYCAEFNGMKFVIVVKNIPNGKLEASIECPMFKIKREVVDKEAIIKEVEKILTFLKSEGTEK